MLVELLTGHPGFNGGVEILGIDAHDAVHLRRVDRDAPRERRYVTFQRGAGAESDDRRCMCSAQLDDRGDFFGGVREGHSVRRMRSVVGLVFAMLGADRGGSGKTIAEKLAQFDEQRRVDRFTTESGCEHGGDRKLKWRAGNASITPAPRPPQCVSRQPMIRTCRERGPENYF